MTSGVDLSSGIDPSAEHALADAPSGVFRFAENFLVAAYDPSADLALWTHLGTWPDDFGLWEDQVLCALPGDEGMLWSSSYSRTPADQRPGGANLSFRCVEPFRRWCATYDGVVVRSPYAEVRSGRVRDGDKERLTFELELECVAPAWDPAGGHAAGALDGQAWASQHYQQLFRATGHVHLEDRSVEFHGTGVRDHSRGQRGHATDRFGGHDLITAAFPDGRAFGMMRMWDPQGVVNLDVGYVVIDGQLHPVEILDAPRLAKDFRLRGEELTLSLRSSLGIHELRGRVAATTVVTALRHLGMAFGADAERGETVFAQSFAEWEWDGEVAHGLTERSDRLG